MKMLLLLLLTGPAVLAQTTAPPVIPATGRRPADFIPAGYGILQRGNATADLNGDGRPDVALVVGSVTEDTTTLAAALPPRMLLVLFRTSTGYSLAAQSRRVVWGKADGGPLGDPFNGISIRHSVLIIEADVGGNWGRTTTEKFRYQQGHFFLIGETDTYGTHMPDCENLPYPPRYDYRDTNFITGEYEIIRTSEECKLLVKKRGKNNPKPLCRLVDYAIK